MLENAKTGGRGLHLHGELSASIDEAEAVRKALRLAGGEWKKTRQHQAHTKVDPDAGWIGYVLKDDVWTRGANSKSKLAHIRGLAESRGFSGDNYAATRDLTAAAIALYAEDRATVLSQRASSRYRSAD